VETRPRSAVPLLLALLAGAGAARAQVAPPAPSGGRSLVISGADLVDPVGGRILPDRNVLVEDGRIVSITPRGEVPIPDEAEIVFGYGRYLLPGLVDGRVQYLDPRSYGPLLLAHGVVLVQDLGGAPGQVLPLRDRLNQGLLFGPEMVACGPVLDGRPGGPVAPFTEVCETPAQGRLAVRRLHRLGVDAIAVGESLEAEVYEAILQEARSCALPVVGALPVEVPLEEALEAGRYRIDGLSGFAPSFYRLAHPEGGRSLEPGNARLWSWASQLGEERLQEWLDGRDWSRTWLAPSLVSLQGLLHLDEGTWRSDPDLSWQPAFQIARWSRPEFQGRGQGARTALAHALRLLPELVQRGAPLVTGSGLGGPGIVAGRSLHEEMELLQKAGLEPAEVIRAATWNAAVALGRGEDLGAIAPGYTASLILVRRNPLEDVRAVRDLEGVLFRGRWFPRRLLDHWLEDLRYSPEQRWTRNTNDDDLFLEANGLPVRRGRYAIEVDGVPAGYEEFLLARTLDGFQLVVDSRQESGFLLPARMSFQTDSEYRVRSVELQVHEQVPTLVSYHREPDRILVMSSRAGEEMATDEVPAAPETLLAGPAFAADFLTFARLNLAVGEVRTLERLAFGQPGWSLERAWIALMREPDVLLEDGQGRPLAARHYLVALETPFGPLDGRVWTDREGLPLRWVVDSPFGRITASVESTTAH